RVTPWLSHIRSYSSRCCTSPPLPWSPGQPAVSPSFPTRRSSALAGIHNVILAQGPQIFFALDVEALDLIEHIGFQQGSYICLDGVDRGCAFPTLRQHLLTHQRITDGGKRGTVADIICQKEDDLAQQFRVGELALAAAALPFQNIPHYHRRIDAVQQG